MLPVRCLFQGLAKEAQESERERHTASFDAQRMRSRMPTEGRTAGPYKSDRVNQKQGMPAPRASTSDVFDANAARPSQHLIAYEWAAATGAAGSQTPGSARRLRRRCW